VKKNISRLLAALLAFGGSATPSMSQEFDTSMGCQSQYWATSEYLMGWIKDGPNSVPLITRGSLSDDLPSALGQPGTQIMAGGDQVDYGLLQGGRITFGKWVDPCQRYGVEASGFLMGKTGPSSSFSSTPTDSTSLSVPIRLPNGTETSIFALVNNPGVNLPDETLSVRHSSQIWGAQGNLVFNTLESSAWNVDGLLGFKHLNLNESLDLNANISRQVEDGQSIVQGNDHFGTGSELYAAALGLRGTRSGRRMELTTAGSIALGMNANEVAIQGSRLQSNPGVPASLASGFVFSEPTNIGTSKHRVFSVAPECKIGTSYWLTSRLAAEAGYSGLYWNNVVRPGDQIDRVVNTTQRGGGTLVGEARPTPLFNRTDLWFHAVSFGLTYRF